MQFYGIQITQETVKNKFDYELSNQVIQTVDNYHYCLFYTLMIYLK